MFQWIQGLLVDNISLVDSQGSSVDPVLCVPAPVVSRAFQQLALGMTHFHAAMRVSRVPFPFPYAQTCDVLLIVYACMTPFITVTWITAPWWAFIMSFTQVFIF